jgi:hypothetical protein
MKTNTFKKVTAILLSTTMMLASGLTVFASSADPDTDPSSTTAGNGTILDYRISTVVVPTAFKLAVNPNGYDINLRYTKLAATGTTYDADTKYYELKSDGTYAIKAVDAEGYAAAVTAGLYTAETSDDQIVTFNYGIASKATLNRKVAVEFAVSADDEIEFVGTEAEATAQTNAQDTTGAKPGEYKIYLTLTPAGADAAITTDTMAKATAWTDADTEYYTWDGTNNKYSDTPQKYTTADAFKTAAASADQFVKTTTIGPEIKSKELGDVTVSAPSSVPIVFASGKGTTSADVTFVLPKATRDLKATEFIDTDTDLTNFADKFELTAVTGVSSFTIGGTMNENAQWNQLTTKAITVTPTYDVTDATGLETAVATGKYQVESDAKTYTVTYNANYTGADPETATESVTVGEHPTGPETAFERDGFTQDGWLDAADGEAIDLNDITGATTVYAKWVEDITDETAELQYISSVSAWYVGATASAGLSDSTFTISSITMKKDSGEAVDISGIAEVTQYGGTYWISVDYAAGAEAGITYSAGSTYTVVAVIGNTRYTASKAY